MVDIRGSLVELHTANTSYIIYTGQGALAQTLHYGARIRSGSAAALIPQVGAGYGGDILRNEDAKTAALSSLRLELSAHSRGDYRAGALLARGAHGAATSDFAFTAAIRTDEPAPGGGMPQGRGPNEVVKLVFAETGGLQAELFYSVFYEADVITKKMRITNRAHAPVRLLRCHSSQLDLPAGTWDLFNLTGAWARETQLTRRRAERGALTFGNGTGASGNTCNPFFFLAKDGAAEHFGEVYGFNLVYSGSHEGRIEQDSFGRVRVTHGIWSEGFSWPLAPGESFVTPEAVLTYSSEGKAKMSRNMHYFVREHILPPRWKNTLRPVLVNNWEGTYFNFTERKLLDIAKVAAGLGVELFVLDDGWFSGRNSDSAGLGDYTVNRKKLPGGLSGLAKRINALGMEFGLWFEPEMVSQNSCLYRAHPDWAVQTPGYKPATGRHQLVLDLCRPEVCDYITDSVNKTLACANIRYVKWDMNRHISDCFSPALKENDQQGTFMHRYILGLYQIFNAVCLTHPEILFEGCASGGNRYDLGILFYMPQVWISDDTDAFERQRIQSGASFGYPQCTMGCHVSAVPNHQTLRRTPLETRFSTAAFGLLGYELDMTGLTAAQRADVKDQIAFYKKYRGLLQYGEFIRLEDPFEADGCRWMVLDGDKKQAIVGDFTALAKPNSADGLLRLWGLCPEYMYNITVRRQKLELEVFGGLINFILPVHLNPDGALVKAAGKAIRLNTEEEQISAFGDALCAAGFARAQNFSGAGNHKRLRFLPDFSSRLYILKADEAPPPEKTV